MTKQNPYNQPPQGQMLPPAQMPPRSMGRQARWAQWLTEQQVIWKSLPKWLSVYSVIAYVLALTMVTIMYTSYSLPWYYMLSGMVGIVIFFIYGSKAVKDTSVSRVHSEKSYEKRLFLLALIPRVLFMYLLYWIFMEYYGDTFGFENADAIGYDELGRVVSRMISNGEYNFYDAISTYNGNNDIADMGYAVYTGFIYWLTNDSLTVLRLIKCLLSSLTVLLLYRLAKRNFGEQTARIAAIMVALWPNFWYYCSAHLKEVEMVFLCVLFVEQADKMLRSRRFTAWKVIPVLLIAAAIFTFRTVLGLVLVLALVFSIAMSSTKVVTWGKRIIVGLLTIALIGAVAGNQIEERAKGLIGQVQDDYQKNNMEWRANRLDASGNKQSFAKYASAAVFAPMIFTIPFPTMTKPFEGQDKQQLLNGGNFIKNLLSFFTIWAFVVLLLSGGWREHLLPLSYVLGYLIVLALSAFAQSERFHQPVMPFEFMFAAYGLTIALTKKKYKRWFMLWCVLMFVAAIAWNWFKLAGRGLI